MPLLRRSIRGVSSSRGCGGSNAYRSLQDRSQAPKGGVPGQEARLPASPSSEPVFRPAAQLKGESQFRGRSGSRELAGDRWGAAVSAAPPARRLRALERPRADLLRLEPALTFVVAGPATPGHPPDGRRLIGRELLRYVRLRGGPIQEQEQCSRWTGGIRPFRSDCLDLVGDAPRTDAFRAGRGLPDGGLACGSSSEPLSPGATAVSS